MNLRRTANLELTQGGLLADSHNILNRWKNYFCHLCYVYGVKYYVYRNAYGWAISNYT